MKKRSLLFTLVAGMLYLGLSSYDDGAARSGYNRTGAKATATNCGGAGCHGGASANTVATIRVDSATGVAVTKYVPGMTYTVTVTGSNTTLTHFGFQYTAVTGTGAAQVNGGTMSSFPAQVIQHATSGLNFAEHSAVITGTAGTPANTTFSKTFNWTAPTTGGDVTMYLTVNAVNNNDDEDAPDVSGNVSVILSRHIPAGAASVLANTQVSVFPNPATDNINLQLGNAPAGAYTATVYDLNGKSMATQSIAVSGAAQVHNISTAAYTPGMYLLSIEKDSDRKVVSFVKQ